jgi:hypothetical protein
MQKITPAIPAKRALATLNNPPTADAAIPARRVSKKAFSPPLRSREPGRRLSNDVMSMTARIHTFPSSRHVKMVAAIARDMRALNEHDAEERLIQHLEVAWDHMYARGIDCAEIENEILSFASAVRSIVWAARAEALDRAVAIAIKSGNSRDARRGRENSVAPRNAHPILHIEIARPTAKVLLKRPFRDAAYIRRHVSYVVKEGSAQGEHHIVRNLLSIRRKLDEMGLGQEVIDREMREIEAAVRAELWRQILTPEVD